MRRILAVWVVAVLLAGCGLDESMKRIDSGRHKADFIIQHLEEDTIWSAFPETHFPNGQARVVLQPIRDLCDWEGRRGKFIDFYMRKEGDQRTISYIYEYFLDCDSLRLMLTYDASRDSVELVGLHIEGVEVESPWLVDPMKSILKDKDWERTQ